MRFRWWWLPGMLWTLPNSALGLMAGVVALPFGARARWRATDLALVFHRYPWGPGGALTLGNTILHTGESLDGRCRTYAHRAGLCVEPEVGLADHEAGCL